jgi:hypothetical protein
VTDLLVNSLWLVIAIGALIFVVSEIVAWILRHHDRRYHV